MIAWDIVSVAAIERPEQPAGEMTSEPDRSGGAEYNAPSNSRQDRNCPRCRAQPQLVHRLLDTRNGRETLLFQCECGERIWDD
jgi:hypothetical protein